ncbi:MAG: threonine dehydratase biosynthetic [Anaerosolibacter sp.]|jgi:diaminopropionate ammonia-lyase|uniref:diaminopropionate ammonia-lyase n=1 Tax=Anaerosolibacter sp. TaxID=1872527 RepID=UPI002615858C|nr:diaminopropionate ammonia-lyase [Anaerosolibacter sp.]MDF2547551.1 threonine dehydratase biosynthetic [Anaerosolibacter sp.]
MRSGELQWIINRQARNTQDKKANPGFLSTDEIDQARNFHRKFESYQPTPCISLDQLAAYLEVDKLWVKDESYRFGLNAFKVLGASYAIGKFLANKLNTDIKELSFERLKAKETRDKLGEITFTTATDGNHGRAVAWAARELGQKAVVYMPKGSSQERLNAILATGAEASITDLNYDDAVRLAAENAEKFGWHVIQDTAWEGYEEVPGWIMQGYGTIGAEVQEQLKEQGIEKPTHIILQAGVGSFAGAIQGYYAALFGEDRPITIILEPEKAACIYKSAQIGDGKPHAVTGDLNTIMAGLACGEPNPIGWEILRDYSDAYFSCCDYIAEKGIRVLANPLPGDMKIISGESGAVGIGLMNMLREDQRYEHLLEVLKITKDARILVISTEGDTDPESYRRILWG